MPVDVLFEVMQACTNQIMWGLQTIFSLALLVSTTFVGVALLTEIRTFHSLRGFSDFRLTRILSIGRLVLLAMCLGFIIKLAV